MGRKRSTNGHSIFSALPPQLKWEIRSQPILESRSSADTASEKQVASTECTPNPEDLLPTQPPDDDSEDEEVEDKQQEATGSRTITISVAEASSGAQETPVRKRVASPDSNQSRAKRRKGKGHLTEVDNEHEGDAWDCTGLVPRYTDASQVPSHLKKYFYQRHSLWPAYSRLPLLMDDTGWFSVTPAAVATHIAERCRSDVVLDAFCGVGGNAVAFARTCERVIAMDNDITRLRLARHNALHHGVADRIEFVLADYVEWAKDPKGAVAREGIDVVFLSPPWGGPEYLSVGDSHNGEHPSYPLSAILPIPGDELFKLTIPISPNIAYFLPRNVNIEELSALAQHLDMPVTDAADGGERTREWVEIEEEWVGDKLKAVTAYYGGLVDGA